MYKQIILNNGLKIVTKPIRYVNSVALGVWIGVGGRFENKKNSGISHFLEHMVFKGSKSRSAEAIKRSIEGMGGTLNGFTGEECTCYWVKVLGKHQNTAFSVLADMVLEPKLDKKQMEKERTVILEEIKMYKDLPNHYVHELLDEIMWPGQPLSMPLTGSIKSVSSIDRQGLLDFKRRCYDPGNIAVVAVGALQEEKLVKDAEKFFSGLPRKKPVYFKEVDLKKKSKTVNLCFKETEQTRLAIGIHGLSRFDPDIYTLALINIILGANMSSRLFNEVREKRGLAYQIVSHTKEYQDTGLFFIDAGIDNRKVLSAIEVILKEVAKLKRKSVKKEELSRAREFYRGQFLMSMEENLNYMVWLGDRVIAKDQLLTHQQILEKVEAVTIEDTERVSNSIFKRKNLKAALIGPLKDSISKEIENITGIV